MPDKGVGASMMELYIETLTGTAFELRVHPAETIQDVKARIQKMEGIPIAQQHLIWESTELEDDYCLRDYNIQDRSTLKLVLTLRGGPINTRRISMEDSSLADLADYGSEDGTEGVDATSQPLTLLLYHDVGGGHMSIVRIDRELFSPDTSAMSRADKDDDEETEGSAEDSAMRQKMRTLRLKMEKVHLDRKLKKMPRPPSHGRPGSKRFGRNIVAKKPASVPVDTSAPVTVGLSLVLGNNSDSGTVQEDSTGVVSGGLLLEAAKVNSSVTTESTFQEKPVSPPETGVTTSSTVAAAAIASSDNEVSSETAQTSSVVCGVDPEKPQAESSPTVVIANSATDPVKRLSATAGRKLDFSPTVLLRRDETSVGRSSSHSDEATARKAASKKLVTLAMPVPPQVPHPPSTAASSAYGSRPLERVPENDGETPSGPGRPPQLDNARSLSFQQRSPLLTGAGQRLGVVLESIDPREVPGVIKSIVRSAGTSKFALIGSARRSRTEPADKNIATIRLSSLPNPAVPAVMEPAAEAAAELPPVKLKRKVVTKCLTCAKRTGLATSYTCRCGNNFCATHRYAEAHGCSFDYKSEGRKLLERSNPVVTAPKLPKI